MDTQINKNKYRAIVFDNAGVLQFFSGDNPIVTAAKILNVPIEDFRKEYFSTWWGS